MTEKKGEVIGGQGTRGHLLGGSKVTLQISYFPAGATRRAKACNYLPLIYRVYSSNFVLISRREGRAVRAEEGCSLLPAAQELPDGRVASLISV